MAAVNWTAPKKFDGTDPAWPVERLRSLAYVVGVLLKGDGSVYMSTDKSRRLRTPSIRYEISLRATSHEFVNYFVMKCAEVLNRKHIKIRGPCSDNCYVGRYCSVSFYFWWKTLTMRKVKRLVGTYTREYLRGRFDSESSVGSYAVYMCGAVSHKEVLDLDRELCLSLGMRTGPVLPYGRIGATSVIRGRIAVSNVQRLRFSVNATDFIREIGEIVVESRNKKLQSMLKGRSWTSWDDSVRGLALELIAKGMPPGKVAQDLEARLGVKVPSMTIYYWSRGTRSWARYENERRAKGVSPNG